MTAPLIPPLTPRRPQPGDGSRTDLGRHAVWPWPLRWTLQVPDDEVYGTAGSTSPAGSLTGHDERAGLAAWGPPYPDRARRRGDVPGP